jgi:FkbM family methyltransferase
MKPVSRWRKLIHLQATISNWPLVLLDRLGIVSLCSYRTRSGVTILCRSRTTDIAEAVVVLSGLEYPPEYFAVDDGGIVLDIGAHIGAFSLFFHQTNQGVRFRAFAFEPFPANAELLRANLALNRVQGVEVVEAAISGHDGLVNLTKAVPFDSVSITDGCGVPAKAYRLSSFCDEHGIARIDFIKMDVEGSEYVILENDGDFFAQSVKRGLIEYHSPRAGRDLTWLTRQLSTHFVISEIHRGLSNGVVFIENRTL